MKRIHLGLPALAFIALVTVSAARPSWTQPRPLRPSSTTPVRYVARWVSASYEFVPHAMNNQGQFAGSLKDGNLEHAAVQKGLAGAGRIKVVNEGSAFAFNDAGTAVGSARYIGSYVWSDANENDTAEPSEIVGLGETNDALDINESGVMVGWAGSIAARWDGQLQHISGMKPSAADSVSDNGRILFKSWSVVDGTTDFYLWTEGVARVIRKSFRGIREPGVPPSASR